jgi:AGCS family alanine or glycine:cation symporter
MVQANSISEMLAEPMHLPVLLGSARGQHTEVGPRCRHDVLTGVVILGGIRSIARVAASSFPIMAVCYVAGCLGILIVRPRPSPRRWS